MGSTGMEPNGAAEVAFLNLGYFDATRFYWDPWAQKKSTASLFLDVRCNPDVAPRLTSGGYEDKVEVISPTSILFIGGGEL